MWPQEENLDQQGERAFKFFNFKREFLFSCVINLLLGHLRVLFVRCIYW